MKPKTGLIDPSLLLRPEPIYGDKPISAFRDYEVDDSDPIRERVRRTYYEMHTQMTVEFVRGLSAGCGGLEVMVVLTENQLRRGTTYPGIMQRKREKWLKFNHFKGTIKEALIKLNDLVDESDPDTDLPNIVHAFQTAERIRAEHPHDDWFHLTGLIHDLGKIMAFYGEPQWCVVGDTFPVGCKWGQNIVYGDHSFQNNPDTYDPRYNTPNGIYEPNCGIEQLMMSWGHDEYLYNFLKHNNAKLPERALYMIRYHSFYPWHAGGDYKHLSNEKDEKILEAVNEFNKFDLYTKSAEVPVIETLWPYYEQLIEKYCPGVLEW